MFALVLPSHHLLLPPSLPPSFLSIRPLSLHPSLSSFLPSLLPPSQEEGEKKWQQNGRRLLRSLGIVFGSVLVASLVSQKMSQAVS